jgi:hypothetical protein
MSTIRRHAMIDVLGQEYLDLRRAVLAAQDAHHASRERMLGEWMMERLRASLELHATVLMNMGGAPDRVRGARNWAPSSRHPTAEGLLALLHSAHFLHNGATALGQRRMLEAALRADIREAIDWRWDEEVVEAEAAERKAKADKETEEWWARFRAETAYQETREAELRAA